MLFSTLSAAAQIDEALEQLVTEVESEEPATAMADMISELQSVRPNLNDTASLSSKTTSYCMANCSHTRNLA